MRFELERNSALTIEAPRGHSPETLRRLREALSSAAPAVPDARRPNFFEVHADEQVFYVHISPLSQKITLLATWAREPALALQPA